MRRWDDLAQQSKGFTNTSLAVILIYGYPLALMRNLTRSNVHRVAGKELYKLDVYAHDFFLKHVCTRKLLACGP